MTRFLRTASTRRLLATIAGLVVAIAAGTAIAVAAAGSGPVPPKTTLARAIHRALAAAPVQGISARISFTNHLINASDFQGPVDPILQGASGRLWIANTGQIRLELQSDNGDAQVVVNNRSFWIYDPMSTTVYEGTLPVQSSDKTGADRSVKHAALPSIAVIQRDINRLAQHLNVSSAIPGDVAGHATYTVRVAPKHDGGLLGAAELAWDAARGVPLRIGIYASHSNSPVLQLKATDISYGAFSKSDLKSIFGISPPTGAKVVRVATPAGHSAQSAARGAKGRKAHAEISGMKAVARHVPFALSAPRLLKHDGLVRRSVTLLDWAGSPAALITYGQNLGGVAVIEQAAKAPGASQQSSGSNGGQSSLSLPTVSIDGATAQELATPLGTVLRFTRGGVAYTVIGSVPPVAAELAARAL
jgi:outer membrane lipoprotein-sorting protein